MCRRECDEAVRNPPASGDGVSASQRCGHVVPRGDGANRAGCPKQTETKNNESQKIDSSQNRTRGRPGPPIPAPTPSPMPQQKPKSHDAKKPKQQAQKAKKPKSQKIKMPKSQKSQRSQKSQKAKPSHSLQKTPLPVGLVAKKAKKPKNQKAKKPKNQKAKKPKSQKAKKPKSQKAKKPKSQATPARHPCLSVLLNQGLDRERNVSSSLARRVHAGSTMMYRVPSEARDVTRTRGPRAWPHTQFKPKPQAPVLPKHINLPLSSPNTQPLLPRRPTPGYARGA